MPPVTLDFVYIYDVYYYIHFYTHYVKAGFYCCSWFRWSSF